MSLTTLVTFVEVFNVDASKKRRTIHLLQNAKREPSEGVKSPNNTILFNGLCNILCILTSYAPLHLMVKLRMRFCNSTQEEVVHSCVDRKLKAFQKYHRFAGTTILLCFIYALLPCRIYCSNKRGNTI